MIEKIAHKLGSVGDLLYLIISLCQRQLTMP